MSRVLIREPVAAMIGSVQGPVGLANTRADPLTEILTRLHSENVIQRVLASALVDTLDTRVYEHSTIECDTTSQIATITLEPQTSQIELIEGFSLQLAYPKAVSPALAAVDNAFVTLGDQNFQLVSPSSANVGTLIATNLGLLLSSADVRTAGVFVSANFPIGWAFSFCVWGKVIPATLGDVIH